MLPQSGQITEAEAPIAALIVLVLGALIGTLTGLLVTELRIPSFLVTLGMLSVFSGLPLTITGTNPSLGRGSNSM